MYSLGSAEEPKIYQVMCPVMCIKIWFHILGCLPLKNLVEKLIFHFLEFCGFYHKATS